IGLGLRLVVVDVEVLRGLVPQHVGVVDRQVVGEALPAAVVAGRQVLCLVRDARRDRDQIEAPGGVAVAVVNKLNSNINGLDITGRTFIIFRGFNWIISRLGIIRISVIGNLIFFSIQPI